MSLLLFVALAGYLVSHRVNQSAIVGIIVMGSIVGPNLLGWIEYTDFVSKMAHIRVIVILFTIGLEFQIKEIIKANICLSRFLTSWCCGY